MEAVTDMRSDQTPISPLNKAGVFDLPILSTLLLGLFKVLRRLLPRSAAGQVVSQVAVDNEVAVSPSLQSATAWLELCPPTIIVV
jgi:hypothetical protein